MDDQPPSHQAPPGGPWPRAVPPYAPPADLPAPPGFQGPQGPPGLHEPPGLPGLHESPGQPGPQLGDSRLLLSRWTKRIAWLGVAATGVFSFVAARSLPGRAATPTSENPNGSQVSTSAGDQSSSTGGSVLQPAAELPQASNRQPYLRSGGS